MLSGFPWHGAPCQMDSLDSCLDSLLFVITTEIFIAVEGV